MSVPESVVREAAKAVKPHLPHNWEELTADELMKHVGELLDRRGFRRWMSSERRDHFARVVITRLYFVADRQHGSQER